MEILNKDSFYKIKLNYFLTVDKSCLFQRKLVNMTEQIIILECHNQYYEISRNITFFKKINYTKAVIKQIDNVEQYLSSRIDIYNIYIPRNNFVYRDFKTKEESLTNDEEHKIGNECFVYDIIEGDYIFINETEFIKINYKK